MGRHYNGSEDEIIIGYDASTLGQQTIYLVLCAVYLVTCFYLVGQLIISLLRKREAYRGKYVISLYSVICVLLLIKGLFYLGGYDVLNYGFVVYRFFGFIPPFLQGACFLIFSLGLQDTLILEQQYSGGEDFGTYRKVQLFTLIVLGVYTGGYVLAYIFDVILANAGGKNIYFSYRMLASVVIVGIVIWSSQKTRKALEKYTLLYQQALQRHIMMLGLVLLHFLLKTITSILFLANVMFKLKCAGYNDPSNWYYVGYLGLYHVCNEYIPSVVIVCLLTFHEVQNTRKRNSTSGCITIIFGYLLLLFDRVHAMATCDRRADGILSFP